MRIHTATMKRPSKASAHFPFYGNDFFQALEGYSDCVIVGYLRALWHYWHHCHCDGLPDDDEYLRRICHCETGNWVRTKGVIFDNDKFFRLDSGKWHQGRCRDEHTRTIVAYNAKVEAVRKAREHNPIHRAVASAGNTTVNDQQPEPEPEPEPYSEPEAQPEPKRESRRFAPPSLEEVKLNGAKIGLPVVECEKFISYYESNGWKVGRNGMRSWTAAMIHWRSNWKERNSSNNGKGNQQQALDARNNERSLRAIDRVMGAA